jgi:hypothetical protein
MLIGLHSEGLECLQAGHSLADASRLSNADLNVPCGGLVIMYSEACLKIRLYCEVIEPFSHFRLCSCIQLLLSSLKQQPDPFKILTKFATVFLLSSSILEIWHSDLPHRHVVHFVFKGPSK